MKKNYTDEDDSETWEKLFPELAETFGSKEEFDLNTQGYFIDEDGNPQDGFGNIIPDEYFNDDGEFDDERYYDDTL